MKPTSSSLQKLTNLLRARTVIRALPPKTVIPVNVLAMIENYHPPPAPSPPPTTTLPRWKEIDLAGRRPELVGRSSTATQQNDGAPHGTTSGGAGGYLPYETTPTIRQQQQHPINPPYLEPISFASAVSLRCRQ